MHPPPGLSMHEPHRGRAAASGCFIRAGVSFERVFYWGVFFAREAVAGRRLGDKGHFLAEHISNNHVRRPHDEHAGCVR